MRLLFWLIAAPVVIGAASFAVSNRHTVEISIWPTPGAWDAPLYIVALGMLGVGFVLGATITWLSAMGARIRAGNAARRIAALEKEVAARAPAEGPASPSGGASSLPAVNIQNNPAKPEPATTV
ncbi:MAG: putative integral membrane protein [Alphaproteobacteria bacterium]|jgi:uncharacterized integral membrane protein